jgi:EmrB/QacA subfamily drug resistance transporter
MFMAGLDTTIVNVALPAIREDLDATVAQLQWTVDAYTIVVAGLMILGGSIADRLGRARISKVGLGLFTLGSLLCSVAPTIELLIAFRTVQALGGAMLHPVAMSIVRNVFPESRERAQAIGIWGGVMGVSMAFGPVLGGALVAGIGWRSIFWVNVPVGIAAIVLTRRFVGESRAPHPRRPDPVGQVLVLVLLASLIFAIIEAPPAGWLSAQTLGLFAVAAAALIALVAYERRRRDPLIELRFFRSAPFSGATAIAVATFVALSGFLFLTTVYLQEVRHLSPVQAGLYMLPTAVTTVLVGPLTGRLLWRVGARPPLVLAGTGIGLSALMLASVTPATSAAWLLAAYTIFGIGFGAANPPVTNTAVSGMPPAQAGVAAAIASTSRQVGTALGIAIVGALAVPSSGVTGALNATNHTGWWIIAGCGTLIVALGLLTTTRWALATAAAPISELEARAAV